MNSSEIGLRPEKTQELLRISMRWEEPEEYSRDTTAEKGRERTNVMTSPCYRALRLHNRVVLLEDLTL